MSFYPFATTQSFPWWVQPAFISCLASVPRGFQAIVLPDRHRDDRAAVHVFSVRNPDVTTSLSFHQSAWLNGQCGLEWATDFSDELISACQRLNDKINTVKPLPNIRKETVDSSNQVRRLPPMGIGSGDVIDV